MRCLSLALLFVCYATVCSGVSHARVGHLVSVRYPEGRCMTVMLMLLQELIASYKTGKLQLMPGCDEEQSLEHEILGVLNQIRTTASEVRIC